MLTSLLPGIRELRPPLAAGALWLVTAFVSGHALRQSNTDAGAFEPIWEIFSGLATSVDDTWGEGVLLTFAAFLVGGLSHAFLTDFLKSRSPAVSEKGRRALGLIVRQSASSVVEELDLERLTRTRMTAVDPVLLTAFDYAEGFPDRPGRSRRSGVVRLQGDGPIGEAEDFVLLPAEAQALDRGPWRFRVREFLEFEVPQQVEDELPSVATRLIGNEQELFDQYDRLRGEAEFRLSLVPPLSALAIAIPAAAFSWESILVTVVILGVLASMGFTVLSPSDTLWKTAGSLLLAAAIGCALGVAGFLLLDLTMAEVVASFVTISVLPGLALAIHAQGVKVQREAGDLLADAIFVGRVQSPLLERLLRTVTSPSPNEAG